jgi:hypothetical protein
VRQTATGASRSAATGGWGRHVRLGLWCALILGWLVTLLYMWNAFATLPSAERLEQTRTMPIPSLGTAAMLAGRSLLELCAALLLLWPWRVRLYAARALAGAVAFGIWFIMTTPLTLSAMGWVHRRWLAAVIAVMLATFLVSALACAVRRLFADRPDNSEAA